MPNTFLLQFTHVRIVHRLNGADQASLLLRVQTPQGTAHLIAGDDTPMLQCSLIPGHIVRPADNVDHLVGLALQLSGQGIISRLKRIALF